MERPNYSFIIPSYNDAKGLKRHLDFFQSRSEKIQLVIVDDCSSDNTEAVILAADPPKNLEITYYRLSENRGPAVARNTGIDLADRNYVMFLDADDQLADSFFDYMGHAPLQNGVDFVLFKYHLSVKSEHRYTYDMHQVDRVFFSEKVSGFPLPIYRLEDRPQVLATVNFPWNKLYRREFLISEKIQFPDLRMHEDITPHWHSFLRAQTFCVLNWAPPLITHYEIPNAGRATNYIGKDRLGVFNELPTIHAEVLSHKYAGILLPVFHDFCDQLFHWMIDVLCSDQDEEGRKWRRQYEKEKDKLRLLTGHDEYAAKTGDPQTLKKTQ